MGLLCIKKPLLTGATQTAHRRAQPLPSGLSPSAPESNRFGRARALFAGLSAHGPHHRRCGISPPPEAAYSIPTSCQNSNMQNPASIKGGGGIGNHRPLAAPSAPALRWPALAGEAPWLPPCAGPGGTQMGAPPARGEIAAPRSSLGGNAPANMPPAPFPSAPAGRRVPFCRPIAAPSRAAFLRRGSAHRRPALSRGPVPAKTKPDAFPQVAGEAPGVSCIGLLRRAAASGGD